MRLTRVHVATPLTGGAVLELPDSAGAHLVRVLRLGVGAALAVFDGRGAEYGAVMARVRGTRVDVELTERRAGAAESRLALTLLQSISRAERMDWTIQKATELGVSRIVPLKTEYTIVRLDAAGADKKRQHWLSVAESACEQCGRAVVPVIDAPLTLPEYIAAQREAGAPDAGLRLALDPQAGTGLGSLPGPMGAASLLVGPEGGLSDAELKLETSHGFTAVRLGPRVLRTETAALAALAALQVLHGDLAE